MATSSKKKRVTENVEEENIVLDKTKKKSFEEKVKVLKKNQGESLTPGTVYLGNIPHGFFEPSMRKFFSQFGTVKQLRLSRSKKSGRSKGYAFIQFECDDVAKIVAETMNNYLMFERLLKCKFVENEECHPELWKGAKRKFKKPKSHILAIKRHNEANKEKKVESTAKRFLKKQEKRTAALAEMGIKLNVGSVTAAVKEAKNTLETAEAVNKKNKASDAKNTKEKPNSKAVDKKNKTSDTENTEEKPDSKAVKTPKNKRQQTLEARSEPPKLRKRETVAKTGLSTGKKVKSVKTPKTPLSSAKKRKLPI